MAQPTAYTRAYDFEGFQTSNPSTPLPAAQVETELNRIKTTLDETLANLAIIQRDDTEIANNSVGIDQLKTEVTFGLNAVTDWETATAYALNAGVWNAGKLYYCIVAHTSGTFATDLAAEKWSLILDVDTTLAAYVTNAQAAQTAAETAQGLSEDARDASVVAQGLSEDARDASIVAQGLAEAARDAAIAAFDDFDDIYLGAKAADPTLDNDGDPLAAGMLYYNTSSNEMKVYSGSAWVNLGAGATAATVSYDNSTSGLTATDVQAAIDEIDAYLDGALAAGAIANSQLANMAEATIKGRAAGSGTGAPVDLTSAQATAILDAMVGDSGAGGTKGLVPAPGAGDATKFLTGAGTYMEAGGGGLIETIIYSCPSQTCTISQADPAVVTVTAQNRPENGCPVRFTTTGALPAGLSTGTTYFVINSSGTTFNVAATKGGTAIATTDAGSGTHTCLNAPYEKATNNPAFIEVTVVGGSGGNTNAPDAAGGAGGGGAFKVIQANDLSSSETVTSGAAGTHATTGGTSSFGSHCSATGGESGTSAIINAVGGDGSGGDINVSGGNSSAGRVPRTPGMSAFGLGRGSDAKQGITGHGEQGLVIVKEYAG